MYGMKRAGGRKGRAERAEGRKGWLKRTAPLYFGLAGTLYMLQLFFFHESYAFGILTINVYIHIALLESCNMLLVLHHIIVFI